MRSSLWILCRNIYKLRLIETALEILTTHAHKHLHFNSLLAFKPDTCTGGIINKSVKELIRHFFQHLCFCFLSKCVNLRLRFSIGFYNVFGLQLPSNVCSLRKCNEACRIWIRRIQMCESPKCLLMFQEIFRLFRHIDKIWTTKKNLNSYTLNCNRLVFDC